MQTRTLHCKLLALSNILTPLRFSALRATSFCLGYCFKHTENTNDGPKSLVFTHCPKQPDKQTGLGGLSTVSRKFEIQERKTVEVHV